MFHQYRKVMLMLIDLIIILFTNELLFLHRSSKLFSENNDFYINIPNLVVLIVCLVFMQILFQTYKSIWRYAHTKEYLRLILAGGIGYLLYVFISILLGKNSVSYLFTISVTSISLLGMIWIRLCYSLLRGWQNKKIITDRIPIAIIGAGEAGVKLYDEMESNPNSNYQVVYFVDDSKDKIGKRIHGIEVIGPIMDLEKLLIHTQVKEIVVAMPSITAQRRKDILDRCSAMSCRIRILPDTLALLKQEDTNLLNHVRDIKLEELLGREEIILDNSEVEQFLYNKVVMVTGGGGSIGSELCRQIAKVKPKSLIVIDNYENNAYDIQQELVQLYGNSLNVKIEIASIRDKEKIDLLFERHRPNIVFHAAAHKHVPLMEDCPEEAIANNIFGTYNVVDAANRYGVDKFVLISTDKAVNPTSVMGASKRFCEMILQSKKENSKTEYVAVRFGNVLGSNGSVIPLFQKQIAQGGPVTITDKRIVRFFMTISEASQLVLQAGAMANSSEIYVLDMGEPVKILDLAENLIRLSDHVPYLEIPIIETGLRPGEKLYEELLINNKELIATKNHKIYIEHQESISQREINDKYDILNHSLETKSVEKMKEALKQVVPTYKDPEEVNR